MSRTRKEKEAFKNVFSIEDFLDRIKSSNENIKCLTNNYFNDDTIEVAIACLNNIKNNNKEKDFLDYMHFVDKNLNFPGQASENKRHKIPTIFAGAIYIDKFEKEFNIYTAPQKMIISKFSAIEYLDFYENINNIFSREVMDTIINKNKDWSFQDDFMTIAYKYRNEKSNEEIINYLNEHDDGYLIRENYEDLEKELEKVGTLI